MQCYGGLRRLSLTLQPDAWTTLRFGLQRQPHAGCCHLVVSLAMPRCSWSLGLHRRPHRYAQRRQTRGPADPDRGLEGQATYSPVAPTPVTRSLHLDIWTAIAENAVTDVNEI